MARHIPARLHLLPARTAPVVAILRRKPSKLYHVISWNVKTDAFAYGAWYPGHIYPLRCDVSPDGKWWVYLARGTGGVEALNGVCKLPRLNQPTIPSMHGSWFGGGYWSANNKLMLNGWNVERDAQPYSTETYADGYEDAGVLYHRLERDGWRRAGPFVQDQEIKNAKKVRFVCRNDPGWIWRPTSKHPTLRMFDRGYCDGRIYEFVLDEYPQLLEKGVDWATWDSLGQLIVARRGGVERFTRKDLERGVPTFQHSFEDFPQPPTGKAKKA